MIRILLPFLFLCAACTEEPVKKSQAATDDGCVGYMIKPDGSKQCVRR